MKEQRSDCTAYAHPMYGHITSVGDSHSMKEQRSDCTAYAHPMYGHITSVGAKYWGLVYDARTALLEGMSLGNGIVFSNRTLQKQ